MICYRHNELRQQVAEGREPNGPQPQAANMKKMVISCLKRRYNLC